jgi:acetolactate synthase-1/2/3 large subunit
LATLDAATDPVHPGPALFVLPLDIAMGESTAFEIAEREPSPAKAPPHWTLETTLRLLQCARRPLLVLGDLCRGHEAEVSALADELAIPFVTTPEAKGVVSELHRFSLRNGGMAASIWARRYTSEPVDACLALGTNLDDTTVGPTRYVGEGGKLIHVHPQASVFGRNFSTALAVCANPGDFSRAFREHAKREKFSHPNAELLVASARESSPFDVSDAATDTSAPIRPHRLLLDLQRSVGPGTRFVTDIGEHMLFALHYLTAQEAGSFQIQLNLGSMGSGVAGAIGLSLADRSRRVACVVGDGCMQMAGMEVLVALRQKLPILFVVFNDGRYNMVHHGMKQIFGEASPYDVPFVDFAAWARSFHMPAAVITRPAELTPELVDGLLGEQGPALIDARIDASVRIRGGGRVEALQHMSIAEPRATA